MIFLKPKAGLCNRLRAIASAIKVAEETGHGLKVLWETDSAMNSAFSDLFERPSEFKIIDITVPRCRIIRSLTARVKNILIRKWNSRVFLPGEEDRFVDCCKNSDNTVNIFLQTYSQFHVDREYGWLRPVQAIQRSIDALAHLTRGKTGVHIRRTDNRSAMRNSPVELFYARIEVDLKTQRDREYFVASDDQTVKDELKKRFGSHIFTRDHVIDRGSNGGVQDAVIDLWLLAMSDKLYGSCTSTFSEEAARIGKIDVEWMKKNQ